MLGVVMVSVLLIGIWVLRSSVLSEMDLPSVKVRILGTYAYFRPQ